MSLAAQRTVASALTRSGMQAARGWKSGDRGIPAALHEEVHRLAPAGSLTFEVWR